MASVNKYVIWFGMCLFFFKTHIIMKQIRKVDYNLAMTEKYENILELVKMFLFVLICAHFMAIIYHTTAQVDMLYFGET